MIPEFAITEWSSVVTWKEKEQVEQDLLICRALTEIYKDESYKQFMQNMTEKMQDPEFLGDTEGLLRYGQTFDPVRAFELVKTTFIDQLPGRRD